jgi:hypothetical protein
MRYVILIIFLIWALWASYSTGALYELKQINPQYVHPNKSAAYLLSKLKSSESSGSMADLNVRSHLQTCSMYMPNWKKAESCVRVRISCEDKSPREKDPFRDEEYGDISSKDFWSCWSDNRPFIGLVVWLRGSRQLWRIGNGMGSLLVAAGLTGYWNTGKCCEGYLNMEKENIWWTKPAEEWVNEWIEKGS